MTDVIVEVVPKDASISVNINQSLAQHLTDAGFSIGSSKVGVRVPADSIEYCNRVGEAIAEFIQSHDGEFKLHLDGPGGETLLHRLRHSDDAETIAGLIASCAYLI